MSNHDSVEYEDLSSTKIRKFITLWDFIRLKGKFYSCRKVLLAIQCRKRYLRSVYQTKSFGVRWRGQRRSDQYAE